MQAFREHDTQTHQTAMWCLIALQPKWSTEEAQSGFKNHLPPMTFQNILCSYSNSPNYTSMVFPWFEISITLIAFPVRLTMQSKYKNILYEITERFIFFTVDCMKWSKSNSLSGDFRCLLTELQRHCRLVPSFITTL